jgi:Rrf2 family protein
MLCISNKGRSATRILTLLASGGAKRIYSSTEICSAEGLNPGYVQQLMGSLRDAGLVVSHRGKQGGFQLSRSARLITVADVLHAMEGEIRLAPCHDGGTCDRIPTCSARTTWVEAASVMDNFFEQVTIEQLADRAQELAVQREGEG